MEKGIGFPINIWSQIIGYQILHLFLWKASTFENCLFRYFFPPVHLTEWGASGGLAEWLELETRKKFHEIKKKLDFAICKFRLLPLFLHILCFFAKIFTQNMKVILFLENIIVGLQKVTLFRMTTFSAPFSIT